jgi:hypothetical protein
VLTRLHARYSRDSLGEDIVFRAAAPIEGGREWNGENGRLEKGSKASSTNNFQARYAIRHAWQGAIACEHPQRGVWGGPPGQPGGAPATKPAAKLAFAPRGGVSLPSFLREDVPELGLKATGASSPWLSTGALLGMMGTGAIIGLLLGTRKKQPV